jgi:hypothetical protein
MLDLAEPERSIIRLTNREREELACAEAEIGETIGAFLRCGRSLSLIRSKRLYREGYATFDRYVEERWAISKAAAGQLLNCYHIAEGLEGAGIKLPADTLQSSMRPLASVPRLEGLRAVVWKYAVSLCPDAGSPPVTVMRRITGIIREALAEGWDDDGDGAPGREIEGVDNRKGLGRPLGNKKTPAGDERFLRAVTRLSAYRGFSVPLIASQVRTERMAAYAWRACERLKGRLEEVEKAIVRQFPSAQAQKN